MKISAAAKMVFTSAPLSIRARQMHSLYRLTLWAKWRFVRATFLTCACLQAGSRNQFSKAWQDCCASGWFSLASSLAAVARTVARTVGTPGAKATANMTNATAEIVIAIFLNMIPRLARLHR
jgi:hypothetical protein